MTNLLNVDTSAKILWDYLRIDQPLKKCDAIFGLGSADTRVAERAARLYHDGFGEYIVFTGSWGKATKNTFAKTEAETFADIAMQMGVPKEKTLIENNATNTGQNVQYTYSLLKKKGLNPRSFILVQKPYMERRTYATFKKQWPDPSNEMFVTSPPLDYENYFNDQNPKERIINGMVGDLQRIKEYPKLNFQIPQPIPAAVWSAWEKLVAAGFTNHLLPIQGVSEGSRQKYSQITR